MRVIRLLAPLALLVIGGFATPVLAATFQSGGDVNYQKSVPGDLFAAGTNVLLSAPVTGEVFAAGSTVTTKDILGRSGYLAGSTVTVTKGATYNLFAGGATVTLDGEYGNDVYVFASSLTILPTAVIHGDLHAFVNSATIAGNVSGSAHITGQNVMSSAKIGGDVTGAITNLTFTGGSIGHNLDYHSATDAQGLNTITVLGKTTRQDVVTNSGKTQSASDWLYSALVSLGSAFVLGALLLWLLPVFVIDTEVQVRKHLGHNLLLGGGILFLLPLVAIMLAFTVIGWQAAALLGTVYAAFLILSWGVSAFVLGRWLLERLIKDRSDNAWLCLLTGLLALFIASLLPVVGALLLIIFFFAIYLPTLGATAAIIVGYGRHQKSEA